MTDKGDQVVEQARAYLKDLGAHGGASVARSKIAMARWIVAHHAIVEEAKLLADKLGRYGPDPRYEGGYPPIVTNQLADLLDAVHKAQRAGREGSGER